MGTRDLLSRHVKLVKNLDEHDELPEGESARPPESLSSIVAQVMSGPPQGSPMMASPGPSTAPSIPDLSANGPNTTTPFSTSASADLDFLWDNLQFNPDTIDYHLFDPGLSFLQTLGRGASDPLTGFQTPIPDGRLPDHGTDGFEWQGNFSTFASRLPSLQPDEEGSSINVTPEVPRTHHEPLQNSRLLWYLSRDAYNKVRYLVDSKRESLPLGFKFPSRHAFSRYIEGFLNFIVHVPFIHTPTVDVSSLPLELVLAMAAVGAQFRLEQEAAQELSEASKFIIDVRVGAKKGGLDSCSISTPSDGTNTVLEIETLQAMIILIAMWTYGDHLRFSEAYSLADRLAHHLRQGGYLKPNPPVFTDWPRWVEYEGRIRTALAGFWFLNIHTIIFGMPPRLLNSDIWSLQIPQPELHWQALTASEWMRIRQDDPPISETFGESYTGLFRSESAMPSGHQNSAFGNLIAIHGILQQIHLTGEVLIGFDPSFRGPIPSPLPEDFTKRFKSGLQRWQRKWSVNKESSTRPTSAVAPVGFNSTALFRIACVRVDFNMGFSRRLESRDPEIIAESFVSAPRPPRSPQFYAAVIQSAHALSIPVRFGIKYVAKTQNLAGSLIHNLCNLECALFLSKWLERLSLDDQSLLKEEKRLLGIIMSVLQETPFLRDPPTNIYTSMVLRQMSCAIMRLITETFKSAHVFEIMSTLEKATERYTSFLERQLEVS